MYDFLAAHLPKPLALSVAILWYSSLVIAILILLFFVPQAPFRYEVL